MTKSTLCTELVTNRKCPKEAPESRWRRRWDSNRPKRWWRNSRCSGRRRRPSWPRRRLSATGIIGRSESCRRIPDIDRWPLPWRRPECRKRPWPRSTRSRKHLKKWKNTYFKYNYHLGMLEVWQEMNEEVNETAMKLGRRLQKGFVSFIRNVSRSRLLTELQVMKKQGKCASFQRTFTSEDVRQKKLSKPFHERKNYVTLFPVSLASL